MFTLAFYLIIAFANYDLFFILDAQDWMPEQRALIMFIIIACFGYDLILFKETSRKTNG